MWKHNLTVAMRVLWRSRLISAINVTGLASGLYPARTTDCQEDHRMANRLAARWALLLTAVLAAPCGADLTSRIAFVSTRDGNREIYVMDADGGNQTNLTNGPWWDLTPCWSPDGQQIAFTSHRGGSYDIFVMNADGSGVRRLTDSPYVDIEPSWSPDGSTIVFCSNRGERYSIYGITVDGGDLYQLTNDLGHDISPAFSPDGTRIAFSSNRRLDGVIVDSGNGWEVSGSEGPGHVEVFGLRMQGCDTFIMDADGTDLVNLTAETILLQNAWPTWSPDGAGVTSYSSDHYMWALLVTVAVGTREVDWHWTYPGSGFANTFNPSWSPDGTQVAFTGNDGSLDMETGWGGSWAICTMSPESHRAVRLTEPARYTWGDVDPSWSPFIEDGGTQVAPASWGWVKKAFR